MNCEKNSVLCEGYNEKQIWKTGKERAEEGEHLNTHDARYESFSNMVLTGRTKRESISLVTLPSLIPGFTTPEDRIFSNHFIKRLSNVLTVEPDSENPFRNILLFLATSHEGLLHSILSISSIHIDLETPYGEALLQQNPAVTKESLQQRSSYHTTEARNCLYADFDKSKTLDKDSEEYHLILEALYGQMLCLVLRTLIEGNPSGQHRLHLKHYQTLIRESPPQNIQLYTFITEFFEYQIFADDLLWHPGSDLARLSLMESRDTPDGDTPHRLGVTDGLFHHLRDITTLRNTIRNNIATAKVRPAGYAEVFTAEDIIKALRDWSPDWSTGDSRAKVGELYKLTLWIYNFRTVKPPATGATDALLGGASLSSYMQERRASIASSTGHLSNGYCEDKHPAEQRFSCSPNPSRTNSIHEEDSLPTPAPTHGTSSSRPPSPPPSRRPSQDPPHVAVLLLDALKYLESFEPTDQYQTMLLIPCLLIGTCCFDAALRPRIRAAVQTVRDYTGLRNADRVQELLNETWALMDLGEWAAVWDWQAIGRRNGIDVLCT